MDGFRERVIHRALRFGRWAVSAVLAGSLVVPGGWPASAQSVTGCMGNDRRSKVGRKGPMEVGPQDVVELKSRVDGAVIQIGFVRPKAPKGYRSPVILHASPYLLNDLRDVDLRDCNAFLVDNYVQHGYTVAFVPTRGAGGTDSCADLMGPKERSDLDQAVDWLGSREWSNGRVGMIGISYDGSTPWEVASTGNPHLKTIVPESGVHNLFDLIYRRGRYDWRWWFFVPGYYHYYGLGLANPLLGRDADRYASSAVCETTEEGLAATYESYATGEYDSFGYWRRRNMDANILRRYRGSVFLVQGMEDWNVDPGHQFPFISRLDRSGVYVKYLLGQWDHAYPDGNDVGERKDFADILLAWWERWLKGRRAVELGPRVEVQDSDLRWRTESTGPPRDARREAFYLSANDELTAAPRKGRATALLGPGTRNRYFFLNSNTQVYNDTPIDHFCVDCAAFTYNAREDLRVVGVPQLRLRVTPSGPGGFVSAYLFRIDPDGAWHKLGWGATDLRFPQGGHKARTVAPGEEIDVRMPLQPLDAVAHAGDKLMLLLDQGHADHMPGVPFFPLELRYGGRLGSLTFETTTPGERDFFDPPKRSDR
jgi:putative CocE/NonD family hydrolase